MGPKQGQISGPIRELEKSRRVHGCGVWIKVALSAVRKWWSCQSMELGEPDLHGRKRSLDSCLTPYTVNIRWMVEVSRR